MRVLAGNATASSPGPRLTPPPARFHTVVGQRYTIALQYATGKDVKSPRTGQTSRMYTLTSGEKAYFDLDVAAAIDSLTLAPGQPFTVCHHGGGTWDIERANMQQTPAPSIPAPDARVPAAQPPRYWGTPAAATSPETDTRPARPNVQLDDSTASRRLSSGMMNGAGETAADLYLRDFQSAIDIVLAGVPLANAKGLMVAPTFEDIRCIATHLAISRQR